MSELYHFGVKGMKWGVHKDRKRSVRTKRSKSDSSDYGESRDLLTKSPNQLSNAQLRKLNERLNLEQQYSNLTKTQKQNGQSFMGRVQGQLKNVAANEVSKGLIDLGKMALGIGITYAMTHRSSRGQNGGGFTYLRQIGR